MVLDSEAGPVEIAHHCAGTDVRESCVPVDVGAAMCNDRQSSVLRRPFISVLAFVDGLKRHQALLNSDCDDRGQFGVVPSCVSAYLAKSKQHCTDGSVRVAVTTKARAPKGKSRKKCVRAKLERFHVGYVQRLFDTRHASDFFLDDVGREAILAAIGRPVDDIVSRHLRKQCRTVSKNEAKHVDVVCREVAVAFDQTLYTLQTRLRDRTGSWGFMSDHEHTNGYVRVTAVFASIRGAMMKWPDYLACRWKPMHFLGLIKIYACVCVTGHWRFKMMKPDTDGQGGKNKAILLVKCKKKLSHDRFVDQVHAFFD